MKHSSLLIHTPLKVNSADEGEQRTTDITEFNVPFRTQSGFSPSHASTSLSAPVTQAVELHCLQ